MSGAGELCGREGASVALLKNTDFEQAVEGLGLVPQVNTAVWLKVGITFGSRIPNYAVAQFTQGEIVVFKVSSNGSIVMPPTAVVPIRSDADVRVQRAFGGYRLEMETPEGSVSLVMRKMMIGAAWHKTDLANVLERFGAGA